VFGNVDNGFDKRIIVPLVDVAWIVLCVAGRQLRMAQGFSSGVCSSFAAVARVVVSLLQQARPGGLQRNPACSVATACGHAEHWVWCHVMGVAVMLRQQAGPGGRHRNYACSVAPPGM